MYLQNHFPQRESLLHKENHDKENKYSKTSHVLCQLVLIKHFIKKISINEIKPT